MKKLLIWLALAGLSRATALAQPTTYDGSYAPNSGYPGPQRTDGITDVGTFGGWQAVLPGSLQANAWSATRTLPFAFQFFGQPVTQFKASANGLLTFDVASTRLPSANEALPSAQLPDQTVAVFWDSFTPTPPLGANDMVWSRVWGTAPNRQFWVVWDSYAYGDPAVAFAYNACVLEETTNRVYVLDEYSSLPAGLTATVGLQRDASYAVQFGTADTQLAGNTPAVITNIDGYTFAPRSTAAGPDAALTGLAAPRPERSCFEPAAPLLLLLRNVGTAPLAAASVTAQVREPGGTVRTLSGSYAGPPLAPGTGGTVALTTGGTLDISAGGQFTLTATVVAPGDAYAPNNVLGPLTLPFEVPLPAPLFAPLTFSGYSGTNLSTVATGWRETTGRNRPDPGDLPAAWTQATPDQAAELGSETGRYIFSTTATRGWLVSPAVQIPAAAQLYFRAAVTEILTAGPAELSANDSIKIWLTADCGRSWQVLRTFATADSLPNVLRPFVVDLNTYAGQRVTLALQGIRNGSFVVPSAAFHFDDVQVRPIPARDLAPLLVLAPGPRGCYGAAEPLRVRVQNLGTTAVSNVPVQLEIVGTTQAQFNATLPGPLAPGASATVAMGTANLATAGFYTLTARTLLPADDFAANDRLAPTRREQLDIAALPAAPFTFAGFTGGNLPAVAPGWREGRGQRYPGTGGNSFWEAPGAAQTAVLGAPTVALPLIGTSDAEWLVSPLYQLGSGPLFLNFRVALTDLSPQARPTTMGIDDSLRVLISTDCGRSYRRLRVFSRADALLPVLRPFSLSLSAYVGQAVQVAFQGTNGPIEDLISVRFHLTDVGLQARPLSAAAALPPLVAEVFPNPASGSATLRVARATTYALCNVLGQPVLNGRAPAGSTDLDLHALTPGLYLLRLAAEGQAPAVRRLVVE